MTSGDAGPAGAGFPGVRDGPAVPGRPALERLRAAARHGTPGRWRLSEIYYRAVLAVVAGAVAIGSAGPLARLLTGPGGAVPGAAGRLFVAAALLLLLGVLAQLLRAAGPVAASSAFRFWLLTAPVSRRDLLCRRFIALVTAACVVACVVAALLAHAGSAAVLPAVAVAGLAAVTVTAGAVWGQACQAADRVVHIAGQAMKAISVLGFGSLATGVGRAGADSALHLPGAAVAALLAALAVAALACSWRAWSALDRIDISVLRRGQGLWTAGQAAVVSFDAFMLADFLAEQRARQAGRVRPTRIGASFVLALARSEWTCVRRRPRLLVRISVAALVWWGCRAVLPGPALAVIAVVLGYGLVLPLAGTLQQLAASPGLRAQFAPRDRWLARASAAACLAGAAAWTAITIPGLTAAGRVAVLTVLMPAGLTAAAWRTVTRPPLDYTAPPVPTPFGDLPLDLWRQVLRGPLLLVMLIILVITFR